MSYEPNREIKSELISVWNSSSESIPRRSGSGWSDMNHTFSLNTVGEGDATIISNAVTPGDQLYGFFMGDIRVNTAGSLPVAYGDQFCIGFELNDGDTSEGYQGQRYHRADDQCYSIAGSAKLKQKLTYRSDGNTIAPFVRVLGILIEE